ncbi:MAG: hypothetical protein ACQCN6_05820 [Candidatus Bathyarchaeia archaeon]|jgi:hypothetical protein
MAYLREENEKFEIDYPLEKVWAAIPTAVEALQWKIEETNEKAHKLKIKTKGGFLAYGSTLFVEVKAEDPKTSRMTIKGETPVTTITAMADLGRTRDRIELFIDILSKVIEKKLPSKKGKEKTKANA